ncbi:hypothetical protein I5U11_14480 [Stenotrophomonas maltophilia]|nr:MULTISPECIES: hypothetical protein [Stenotrophomonas]MBB1135708.1 hypothetical protein [Stenotrophomonas sp. I18B00994]MBH1559718.1 hypothetical protein [Stenotrophomonas maltophilia]
MSIKTGVVMSKIFYERLCACAFILGFFAEMAYFVVITHNALVFRNDVDIAIACLALVQAFVMPYKYKSQAHNSSQFDVASMLQKLVLFGLAAYAAWSVADAWHIGLVGLMSAGIICSQVVKICLRRYSQLQNSVQC